MTTDAEKERLERYTSAMGEELGLAYGELTRNLIDLRIVWQQYRQLFGTDQETINLLNRTSGLFFQVVERGLGHGSDRHHPHHRPGKLRT